MSKVYVYDEVTEKYIVAHSLLPDYTRNLTRWQHKNNVRITKILTGKVDEKGLADADDRIQKLVQECLNSDGSVAAKSKVSRHLGIDNDNPLGNPPRNSGTSDDAASSETLSGLATGHEVVSGTDIIPSENDQPKKEMAKAGFAISSRLQGKADEQQNNS